MKNLILKREQNDKGSLKDLHKGKIVKELALQKRVSFQKIANTIRRYQQSPVKIYHLDDMSCWAKYHDC